MNAGLSALSHALFEPEASCGSAGLTEDADLVVRACAHGIRARRSSRSVPATRRAARGAATRWLRSQRSPRGASRPTLFALEQALALYDAYWQNAWACDARIEATLKQLSLRRGRTHLGGRWVEFIDENAGGARVCARTHGREKGPAASRAVMRNKAQNPLERDPARGLRPAGPKPAALMGGGSSFATTRLS
jgi:hypothetical protein